MIASDEKRLRKPCERMDMSDSPMGERYFTVSVREADKRASEAVGGLRKQNPVGPRHVKRRSAEFVYPKVHLRLSGVKQLKGAKKQVGLKGVRVKLSGKKLAVWKLENGNLLERQRVDDIAACALRARVKRAKSLAGRVDGAAEESDEESDEEAEERYKNSLHNKELQVELGGLVDILRANDAEAEARLQGIF